MNSRPGVVSQSCRCHLLRHRRDDKWVMTKKACGRAWRAFDLVVACFSCAYIVGGIAIGWHRTPDQRARPAGLKRRGRLHECVFIYFTDGWRLVELCAAMVREAR